jgi:hypothetical protein
MLTTPPRKEFLVTKTHIKKCRGYVRWPGFFKNCRATEEEEEEIIYRRLKIKINPTES